MKKTFRAQIQNLKFELDAKKSTLKIMWHANCGVVRDPVTYRVSFNLLQKLDSQFSVIPSSIKIMYRECHVDFIFIAKSPVM